MIGGVQVILLKRIPDERGKIFHMLKCTDPHYIEFGEIYFSTIYPGVIMGCHLHNLMMLNYACIYARIKPCCTMSGRVRRPRGRFLNSFSGRITTAWR